jgi:hypothetical protein
MYDCFPLVAERTKQPAGTLSGGEEQMLAFARAIPRLLLLDGTSMGLATLLVEEVADRIVEKQGTAVLSVERNAILGSSSPPRDTGRKPEGQGLRVIQEIFLRTRLSGLAMLECWGAVHL